MIKHINKKTWGCFIQPALALLSLTYIFGGFFTYYFSVSISPDNKMFVVTTPREIRVYSAKGGWLFPEIYMVARWDVFRKSPGMYKQNYSLECAGK